MSAMPAPAPSAPPARDLASLWQALQAQQAPEAHRASRLGEALVARGLVTPALLTRALAAQQQSQPHRLLGRMLAEAGVITEQQLAAALADWLGLQVVDLRAIQPEATALAACRRRWPSAKACCR
jgi:hypothetical protein